MATSARDRFNILFKNYPLPPVPPPKPLEAANSKPLEGTSIDQIKSEQDTDEVRHVTEIAKDVAEQEKSQVTSKSPLVKPAKPKSNTLMTLPNGQQDHIPGTNEDQIVYVPGGIWSGGLSATQIDTENQEKHQEPQSTTGDLIGKFCHFNLLTKFPYKYMQDPGSRVSQRFFAAEQIYKRNWDMHYIWGPDTVAGKPLLLVPFEQVQELMDAINKEFTGAKIGIPPFPFTLSFFDDGTPSPQRLGCVDSKADLVDLQNTRVQPPSAGHDHPRPSASNETTKNFDAWREKLEEAYDAEKKKKSKAKSSKTGNPGSHPALSCETAFQLKRAQRYLGLRAKPAATEKLIKDETAESASLPFEVASPAPYQFENEPIIIAFDVEAYERAHNIVTEIGVSTLDTRSLKDVPSGQQGENWIKHIRSRHFRIKGRDMLRNTEFVHGDPEMFRFGVSEFVAVDEAADAIDSCFEHPYSAGFECEGPPSRGEDGNLLKREPRTLDTSAPIDKDTSRNIILLGHAIGNDDAYLAQLGSSIFGKGTTMSTTDPGMSRRQRVRSSILETLDTAVLHQSLTRSPQPMSLEKICFDLDIDPWNTHNAGNDARYTLEAFVKLVLQARLQDDVSSANEVEMEKLADVRVEGMRKQMEERLRLDEENLKGTDVSEPEGLFAKSEDANGGGITFEEAERRFQAQALEHDAGDWDDAPSAQAQEEEEEDYPY